MLFTTPTQYAVLALLLVAGWLFGLASHPGGRKWRDRYEAEREAHAAYRDQADARIDALERENAALGHARVAVPAAALPMGAPARGPWLGAGDDDDLTRIRGIDAMLANRLRAAGIRSFADIEAIPANAETALEREIGVPDGTIGEQRWRALARMLREGNAAA
ncbi:hypothetical protein ACFO8O_00485 [Hephaestia sp. GCM10023244]|uniref:hypothetical protein n=1 Tax=unclassified Hephaestia TaxID=2631281 RepID=UPI0020778748|nr:hypothetical protein [Hephaestia sp. MAHUQ-44]MCM8729444.1 hypothetical protein [Hephaestia sp. MAHUQ-44]